ncbi:MAG: methyltransferase domain-containing protein [Elusimicrobia bacterium]|nr:methyltransferase domain-containing protein [Candidatus Obscuribacterium magneticum]
MNPLRNVVRRVMASLDSLLGTNFKLRLGNIYRWWLWFLSPLRRWLDPIVIRCSYALSLTGRQPVKLHLGCGHKHFDGYINMDLWLNEAVDVVGNITRLPWPDGAAETVESYHVLEHISHPKVPSVLKEWHRVLAPGGRLVLELPHFDEAVKDYLSGNESRIENIFGHQRFPGDAHLFGYTPARLTRLLERIGFTSIIEAKPQSSQTQDEPSFRLECKKQYHKEF